MRLCRLFGIDICLDASVLLIFALIVYSVATGVFPAWHPTWSTLQVWSLALVTGVLFFASLLAHELAHSLTALRFGLRVPRITLFLLGGVAEMEREPERPSHEFLIAIAGPLMSLAIGTICLNVAGALAGPDLLERMVAEDTSALAGLGPLATMLVWLGAVNTVLALFNLVPGFPLDGGRVFRAVVWGVTGDQLRATRWASDLGRYFGWALMAMGMVNLFGGGVQGLWLVLVGWFLSHLARSSYQQMVTQQALGGLRVGDLMRTRFDQVAADVGVADFIDQHLLRSAQLMWPVMDGETTIGTISLPDIVAVAPSERAGCRVADVMQPLTSDRCLDWDLSGRQVVDRLERAGSAPMAVLRDGRVVGLIHRGDIVKWLALNRP